MAKDKKKGKGFFGKIADAIKGNETPEQTNDQHIDKDADNGADHDVILDQSTKPELKETPVHANTRKSYSDMLRERTESKQKFSREQIDKMNADKNQIVNDNQIVQK